MRAAPLLIAFFLAAPAWADQTTALDALILEDAVRGAHWRDATLVVEVNDDGTKRDGLAESICLLLREHGAATIDGTRTMVKVTKFTIKAESSLQKTTLGAALCPMD